MNTILITPLDMIDSDILSHIARVLQETYRRETISATSLPIPHMTYNALKGQFNATKILKVLEALKPQTFEFLFGVTDQDLYVPEFNFVFGEADVLARLAVMALPRLRQEYYDLEPDRGLFF
ncbi:MAG TPA: hypothetical protein VEI57_09040 [Nitrospirota bacterium]|nr:hypothetical protein [Nitrospirota bacterium]